MKLAAALFGVVLCLGLVACGGDSEPKAGTTAATAAAKEAEVKGLPNIGSTVKVGDLDLTIISVNPVDTTTFNMFNRANVAIRIEATNARGEYGKKYLLSTMTAVKAVDIAGVAHTPLVICTGCPDEIVTVSLIQGETIEGYIYFQIPRGSSYGAPLPAAALTELRYQQLLSDNKVTINLQP